MIRLHSDEAKQRFRALKPQLVDTIAQLRSVLSAEIADAVPLRLFDGKVTKPILQRFDDATEAFLRIDE